MIFLFYNNQTLGKGIAKLENAPHNLSLQPNECIIDENHQLFHIVNEFFNHPESSSALEPTIVDGELIDIQEVSAEIDEDQLIMQHALENLNSTDYQVIKNMEVLMDTVAEAYSIKLPYENLHETRQKWRDWYNNAEENIRKKSGERYYGKKAND